MRFALEDALEQSQKKDKHHNDAKHVHVEEDSKLSKPSSSSSSSLDSCIAYEISLYANQTYALNFHEPVSSYANDKRAATKCMKKKTFAIYTKLIEQLQPQDVNDVDLWTMSPPCQPFTSTRHAKQRDSADERCKGFKAIMNLLRRIHKDDGIRNNNYNNSNVKTHHKTPKWILLENVKGFYGSDMLRQWYECLKECGYTWEEYLLSPTQIGIPNNRTRYYMVAERSNRFATTTTSKIAGDDNNTVSPIICVPPRYHDGGNDDDGRPKIIKPLLEYIHELDEKECQKYIIPRSVFEKEWAKDIPVVCALDRITHCFTAAYGRQIHRATGSLLLMMKNHDDEVRTHSIADEPLDRSDMSVYKGRIRRFTEYELLGLFGFPARVSFPDTLSRDHKYKLIGNSVSVKVISLLLQHLLLLD